MRRVLYALSHEAWRIEAYLLLWATAEKSGWNAGFERMEGSLLGYEDWQDDIHIARWRPPGSGWRTGTIYPKRERSTSQSNSRPKRLGAAIESVIL